MLITFNKLVTLNLALDVNINKNLIEDYSYIITNIFRIIIPKSHQLSKNFDREQKLVKIYYSEFSPSTKLIPIVVLIRNKLNDLIYYMDEFQYIPADVYFIHLMFIFNYWIEYINLVRCNHTIL